METAQEELYIGIDLGRNWTQISYFSPHMKEPETVSTVAGEERYRIPTTPYEKSLDQGNPQKAGEMLKPFLKKILRYIPQCGNFSQIRAITCHLESPDLEKAELIRQSFQELGIPKSRVWIQDSKESFCHFAMHQEKELMQHDSMLFLCEKNDLTGYWLTREEKTYPQKVEIMTLNLGELPVQPRERDEAFARMAETALHGKIVSAVYLMGDGLEGGWLKDSLYVLCRGRRAFQGKNLYTRGACYQSYMQMHKNEMNYIYFGEQSIRENIYLQVKNKDRTFFRELVEAGTGWYEADGSCQVLLDGEPAVDLWLQAPESKHARIVSLQLTDLPKRPPKATRLQIEAVPGDEKKVMIRIRDLGFGPWYASSGKVWEYSIDE